MNRRQTKKEYVETYHPFTWVQTSGLNVTRDAEFVISLPKLAQREKELRRLAALWGDAWVRRVKDQVQLLWPQREAIRARFPTVDLDTAVRIINGVETCA